MQKKISLLSAFVLIIFFSAFKKDNSISPFVSVSNNQGNSKFISSTITLTVTCLSNRTQPLGGSFKHKIKLMNGISPIANADVKINDPIGRVCTLVTTNSNGEAAWILPIPLDTKPECYAIEFFYGDVKCYSGVAIIIPSDAINLPSYKVNLNSVPSLDNSTLVATSRGGFASTRQTINTTLQETVKIGKAVINDYLSNPFNKVKIKLMLLSCSAALVAPPAGIVCGVSVDAVASDLIISDLKLLLYKGIDATSFPISDKIFLKNIVDLSTVAYAVATLNPSEGLSKIDALGAGYDFVKNTISQPIYFNGVLKGASIAVQKAGSSEVYMISIYNRDTTTQTNIENKLISKKSKDPNCEENNTGDYCFQNNTGLNLLVNLMGSPSKKFRYTPPLNCTLQPGQKQCFYSVPAGAANYEIKTPATVNVYQSGKTQSPPKTYSARGSLYVEPCQENTFFINLETASYSSDIHSQTNESQIPKSKDADCEENNTGDYCFQNTTALNLEITLMSSPSKKFSYTSPFTCTIQPGQIQCFFNVPAGAANYEIKTPATVHIYHRGEIISASKTYFAKGSLYVDPCKENTFVIK